MCRSIKVLRKPEGRATPEETRAAALQFVRKISGFPKPSQKNQAAFERAVEEITAASQRLLREVESGSQRRANFKPDHIESTEQTL
jgi:hypothetical protein